MIDPAKLPPSVWIKIAQLENGCTSLAHKLDAARKRLQELRIQRRDTIPNTVDLQDFVAQNLESDRVLFEWQRLDEAAAAQIVHCEEIEQRLRSEEATVAACKAFLHGLPAGAKLSVAKGYGGGNLEAVRGLIRETQDEIARVQRLPVPSADFPEKIGRYVAHLAVRGEPIIRGIADGQTLSVHFPLRANADRVTMSGFSEHEANPLLLLALVQPDRLAEHLTQAALEGSITATERDARLHTLQEQLTRLRYDEEQAVTEAINNNGGDVSRSGTAPPWAVLMVEITHQAQAAA